MEFWYLYVLICTSALIFAIFIPDKYRIFIIWGLLTYLWVIGSFRYMIGTDYYSYVKLYTRYSDIGIMDVLDQFNEPLFTFICMVLNDMGFDFQMLFVVFNSLILIMYYKGVRYFFKYNYSILFAIVVFALFASFGGYFQSWNGIRQYAAMGILFFSSRYILERKFIKFLLCMFISVGLHYSAIIFLPFYWLFRFNIKKEIVVLLLSVELILSLTGIFNTLFMQILTLTGSFVTRYGNYLGMSVGSSGITITQLFIFELISFVVILYGMYSNDDNKSRVIINFSIIYIACKILFLYSFGNIIDLVTKRICVYFMWFFLMYITLYIENFIKYKKSISKAFIIALVIVSAFDFAYIRGIDHLSNDTESQISLVPSLGNINYEFNFKLIK